VGLIFDSCIWVGIAAGQVTPQAVIAGAGDVPVFTSVISLGELSFGVQSCTDPAERALRAAYLRQVESRPALEVSKHTAAAFGVLAAAVKQSGRSPRPRYNDLWIAAQAIEHGYALLTLNVSDFAGLPGLRCVTPYLVLEREIHFDPANDDAIIWGDAGLQRFCLKITRKFLQDKYGLQGHFDALGARQTIEKNRSTFEPLARAAYEAGKSELILG
jgi:predicted nucleic acid-binding protein